MTGQLFGRRSRRTARIWQYGGGSILFLALGLIILPLTSADEDTNAPPSTTVSPAPDTSSNSPSATPTFTESHPELAPPAPAPVHFSLQPAPPPDNPPEGVSSGAPPTVQPSLFSSQIGDPDALPAHLLVVYNRHDPDAKGLADYYAAKRNIAPEWVLPIACPLTEEITRREYEESVREPIMSYIYQKGWMVRRNEHVRIGNVSAEVLVATTNEVWAIVLIRGIPLKIAEDPSTDDSMETDPALQTNAASVDSELALLPIFGLPFGGFVPNPFFDNRATCRIRAGPELATKLILVTRLDGPQPSDVRRMIDGSLAAEQNRLAGLAVIDSRGITDVTSPYVSGDTWLRRARDMLTADGWSVKFDDKPDPIPATDPCNHVALYLGWYAGDAMGPWVTPPIRFVPGAIAYHLHSYSASTVRSETSNWVGPLIAHGAAATMGTVYEPYLALTPHLDIFTKHLLDGESFAEAAYASQPGLSWMVTVVGDPLYRPFAKPLDAAVAEISPMHTAHDDWLVLQQIQKELAAHTLTDDTATLVHDLDVPGSGAVAQEGLGDLLEKLTEPLAGLAAEQAYKKAMTLDPIPVDQIRVGLKLAQHYVNRAEDDEAQDELKTLRELYPEDAQRFGVASQLVPTSPPPLDLPAPVARQSFSPHP